MTRPLLPALACLAVLFACLSIPASSRCEQAQPDNSSPQTSTPNTNSQQPSGSTISDGNTPKASVSKTSPALDPDIPLIEVNVKLVNVFTNVTDATGAIVGGLTKEDFSVSEDDRPQQIAVFERQSEVPLNLVLAIDTSGSVRKDLPIEQDAAKRFVHALLRAQDQMSLLEFSTQVRELVGFTNQPNRIDRALGSLRGGPATALYDAIYLGSQSLAPRRGRKVLILVTDGGDTANTVTYAEALEQALRGEVMVYSIIDVPIAASAGRDTGGEHALITLAEQTGGKYFYADSGGLDQAFAKVSEDLRTQYLIGYYPAHQAPGLTFHRIHISIPRAKEDAFQIRYRTGYFSDASPSSYKHQY